MKNLKSIALALLLIASGSSFAQTKKIDATKSKIEWIGKKVTGQHNGTVNFKEGSLVFKGKKITGGNFIVDMNSLITTDLSGEYQQKLDGHLKGEDFFGTEKFPTSTLVFKKVTPKSENIYTIVADLTIKGITNSINFDLTTSKNTATTTFNIDRTKYNIKYKSKNFFENLGDKAIIDEFELKVNLKF